MIKLTVTYPKGEGITFDHDYYANKHVPMCEEAFSPARVELDKGIDGPAAASVSFYFETMDKFNAAMASPVIGSARFSNFPEESKPRRVSHRTR